MKTSVQGRAKGMRLGETGRMGAKDAGMRHKWCPEAETTTAGPDIRLPFDYRVDRLEDRGRRKRDTHRERTIIKRLD